MGLEKVTGGYGCMRRVCGIMRRVCGHTRRGCEYVRGRKMATSEMSKLTGAQLLTSRDAPNRGQV